MTDQQPWHQHPATVVLLLFCCWPVGVVLLWKQPRAPKWLKWAVTIWIVLSVLFALGAVIDFLRALDRLTMTKLTLTIALVLSACAQAHQPCAVPSQAAVRPAIVDRSEEERAALRALAVVAEKDAMEAAERARRTVDYSDQVHEDAFGVLVELQENAQERSRAELSSEVSPSE